MKKYVLGLITGLLITGTVVYAAYKYQASEVGYTPSNENFNVDNVEDAIEELYDNISGPTYIAPLSTDTHKGIIYLDPTNLKKKCTSTEVNTNYTENGTNGIPTGIKTGCMKWYVINDSENDYIIILDHNTTAALAWDNDGEYTSYISSDVKPEVVKLVNESEWEVQPRLITTAEIKTITEYESFSTATHGYYYFDSKSRSQTANAQNPSRYAWLFNYTNCASYGCDISDSSVWGYYTSDTVSTIPQSSDNYWEWNVWNGGYLQSYVPNSDRNCGIRPVITISKSIIKP